MYLRRDRESNPDIREETGSSRLPNSSRELDASKILRGFLGPENLRIFVASRTVGSYRLANLRRTIGPSQHTLLEFFRFINVINPQFWGGTDGVGGTGWPPKDKLFLSLRLLKYSRIGKTNESPTMISTMRVRLFSTNGMLPKKYPASRKRVTQIKPPKIL